MPTGKRQIEPDHGALLRRIAAEVFGAPASAEWVPSDEADVFILHRDQRRVVVKVERPDLWVVRREAVAFPALRRMGFDEFPVVEMTRDGLADGADCPAFMVMQFTEHRPWDEIWADDPDQARWVTQRIGLFLRRLSAVEPSSVPGAALTNGPAEWFREWFAPLLTGADRAVGGLVERCLDHMAGTPTGFGGWQFAQALTDGTSTFTAIDWGNLGRAWPMADLAGAVFGLARFGDEAVEPLRDVLVHAYTEGSGLGDEEHSFWLWTATWWLLFASSAHRRGDPAETRKMSSYALDTASRA